MKNKKGITIGRVLLYILFGLVFLMIIWVLVLTYREIAKNPNTTTKIECENNLRYQNENDIPVNLYNNSLYPFLNVNDWGESSSVRSFTGAYIFLKAGTYSLSTNSSFYSSGYRLCVEGFLNPGYYTSGSNYFATEYNSTDFSFTLNQSYFCGFLVKKDDGSSFDYSDLNIFNFMLNEGSISSFIPYNQNYQNANSYISNCYFTGAAKVPSIYYPGGAAYPYGYVPVVASPNLDSSNMGTKTNYNISTNSNILYLGTNVSSLYTNIYNSTYNFYMGGYHFTNISYSSTFYSLVSNYDCSTPIPIYLFNFDLAGSDLLLNSDCVISFTCNDNINVSVHFSNLNTFTYDLILNANPNIRSINSFRFNFYLNSSIMPDLSSSNFLQNKSWDVYKDGCYFYLVFNNFFGNSDWVEGYQEGYREGQAAANESLQIAYDNAMNQVNDLTSQVSDLTSRVNTQSDIITNLQNQINNANLGFKNFFFTMADVPFKTVSNVLGFEVFGLNLFQFFTGILTALGCIWLIKKFL